MVETKNVRTKICLVGDGGVGKTSLIGRYVYDIFNDRYLPTIGTKVTRKELVLRYPTNNLQIKMDAMIWDIMGQKLFKSLLHESYFIGARGIIAVCDLTDKQTLLGLIDWVKSVNEVVGRVPLVVLANKSDLDYNIELSDDEIRAIAKHLKAPYIYTSARTGENVADAFVILAREMIKNQFNLT
ncbi:MAG: GTP-binding protein [Thermoplasmata archaeon]|nr:MAG: GTP-binding protein [Thermoplasmata archaeon]